MFCTNLFFAEILHSFFSLKKRDKNAIKEHPQEKRKKKNPKKQEKNKTIEELKLSEFHCISHQ